ncbi:MAG: 2-isopropylmalate synthase [Candidatus Micrarchaeia archaeon]
MKKGCAVVNIAPVRKQFDLPEKVMVFDTTLRDGEQTPGVALNFEQKREIAFALDDLGVDVIEAGFPVSSFGEQKFFKELSKEGFSHAELCGLSRCNRKDIDAVIDSGSTYVHTFIATSDLHMKYKLKMTYDQVLAKAVECVEYIKSRGCTCEFSPEDASRSDLAFLKHVCKAVEGAGADKINVPDTVGASIPPMMFYLISELKKTVKVPLSVHCHDDFGLAVANTLACVEAGARQVQCTVNGIGERAGNAALEETIPALRVIYGVQSNVKTEKLYSLSQLVARYTRAWPAVNKAIVGENAFAHGSGVHVHGVLGHALTYEPINPVMVGQKRRIVYGKLTGAHAIKARLVEMGFKPSEKQLGTVTSKVKRLGDLGKRVRDAELAAIAREVFDKKKRAKVVLVDSLIKSGTKVAPCASVILRVRGKRFSARNVTGDGPVDAALKAIQKALSQTRDVRLKEYELEAVTGGSDALCEVSVLLEDSEGNEAVGTGVGGDIIMTSVEAMIDGINGLV